MFFTKDDSKGMINANVDEYGDSFARDIGLDELRHVFQAMPKLEHPFLPDDFRNQLEEHHHELLDFPSWIFEGTLIHADLMTSYDQDGETRLQRQHEGFDTSRLRMDQACKTARFAGARFTDNFEDENVTHILVQDNRARAKELRKAIST